MKKNLLLLSILILVIFILSNCGIEPPTQDLELAKKKLAAADEVEASKYAPEDYKQAQKMMVTGKTNIIPEKDSQNKDALEYLQQSQQKADTAYKKAAPKFADAKLTEGNSSLSQAEGIKANVAAKDDYDKAQALLNESKAAYDKKDYKTSWTKSKEAKIVADQAYTTAKGKEEKAKAAIEAAKQEVENATK